MGNRSPIDTEEGSARRKSGIWKASDPNGETRFTQSRTVIRDYRIPPNGGLDHNVIALCLLLPLSSLPLRAVQTRQEQMAGRLNTSSDKLWTD